MPHTTQVTYLAAILGLAVSAFAQDATSGVLIAVSSENSATFAARGSQTTKQGDVINQGVKTPRAKRKAVPEPELLDMRPAAVCQRQVDAEWQKYRADGQRYLKMDITALKALQQWALKCIPNFPQGIPLRMAVVILEQVSWNSGYDAASENLAEVSQAERSSVVHERDALVDKYNALVHEYNDLVTRHNNLLDSAQNYMAITNRILALQSDVSSRSYTPPVIVLPRPATELHCTATALAGNMASINCW